MTSTEPGYLTIAQVAAELGRSEETVRRWIVSGVKVGGKRVRLAGHRLGWFFQVSREALAQFVSDCNPSVLPEPVKAHRQNEASKARERLKRRLGKGSATR